MKRNGYAYLYRIRGSIFNALSVPRMFSSLFTYFPHPLHVPIRRTLEAMPGLR